MIERVQIADVAQIYELWNEYAAAATAGDMERWLALWVDDGIQMPPGAERQVGKKQIRTEMQPRFDLFDQKMVIDLEEVRILGDRAYSHGTYEFALTPKEGGETSNGSGKFLTILAKQTDGSWKIVIDCFNYNAPPE
ncbi:MAG: nuclear transport factor 2 family protein [Chloroflexi bacterium]|nr:nuclear transport factor 2 family protein [Chloroflexota bacterium]